MADSANSLAELENRVARLGDVVNTLIDVVTRLDNETSDTAAAAFNPDVPRVVGHKATVQDLKALSQIMDSWRNERGAS